MRLAQNILVVEDDRMMVDTYKTWFISNLRPSSNIMVHFALDGDDADRLLSRKKYSITILDLALPGTNGDELVVRHSQNMGAIIVASSFPECGPNACEKASCIITKPFDGDRLLTCLSRHMEGDWHVNQGTDRESQSMEII